MSDQCLDEGVEFGGLQAADVDEDVGGEGDGASLHHADAGFLQNLGEVGLGAPLVDEAGDGLTGCGSSFGSAPEWTVQYRYQTSPRREGWSLWGFRSHSCHTGEGVGGPPGIRGSDPRQAEGERRVPRREVGGCCGSS